METRKIPDSLAERLSPRRPFANSARYLTLPMGLLWLCVVVAGLGWLWNYAVTPGRSAIGPERWPAASHLAPEPHGDTLIMLAHPRCPCTRASLSELARIMAHRTGPVRAYVLFYRPRNAPAGWEKTDLYDRASAIPGVHALSDTEGVEARRFHATTSGQTLLYAADGHLRFSGGITGARGHEGDNAGQQALIALLQQRQAERTRTPVYGCVLIGPVSK